MKLMRTRNNIICVSVFIFENPVLRLFNIEADVIKVII